MAAVEPQLLTAPPRGVCVEWPCSFDGNEARQWLDKIEKFFNFYEMTDPYRLKIAAIYFDGPVVPWFQELQKSKTPLTSSDFDCPCFETQVIDVAWPIPKTAGDALELFAEMPESDKAAEDMVEEIAASDEPESKQFHQTAPDGIEERDINFINLPNSLPQEGEVQENLEMAKLMNENVHLKPVIDDLKKKTLAAEFATVRHQIEVLEDSIEDMVQPVNFVAILTTSHRPDHIALIPAGPLNREEQIWASTDDVDWRLSSDSGLWHCIQTLELRSSSEPQAEVAFFNQVVGLPHSTLLLLANAKKIVIYAVHLDYGLVDVFDVFQQLNPWVEAVLLDRCDRYSSMEASEELIENSGRLHLLVITHEKERVTGLKIEHLEETSVASTTPYLANVVVYIGSNYGDSQLIKLNMQPDAKGSYVNILEAYVNLGPIVDFCIVDLKRQGQDQVVTCSGAYKDGSLRVVRNDIGINEQASVDLQGITDLWPLRCSTNDPYDTFLVVSFINETRVLAMNMADELEETEIAGFYAQAPKLFWQNAINDQLLPVASGSVRLVSSPSGELIDEWNAPTGFSVNVATTNAIQVLLATSGGHLVYLEIGIAKLSEVNHTQLEYELSCLDINPMRQFQL